jgi:hypothetical protein
MKCVVSNFPQRTRQLAEAMGTVIGNRQLLSRCRMKTVAEYRQFAQACRELASKLTDPKDKHAIELIAGAWEQIAADREAVLKRGLEPISDNVP